MPETLDVAVVVVVVRSVAVYSSSARYHCVPGVAALDPTSEEITGSQVIVVQTF